jgi:hypothetical protein
MDPYLLKYICDFLTQCELCKIMEINAKKCCICKVSYCNKCKIHFKKIVGFYENYYCNECYQWL